MSAAWIAKRDDCGGWVLQDGQLTCVSQGSDGSAWGCNGAQGIFRRPRAGAPWAQLPGAAASVSAPAYDAAVAVNAAGEAFLWQEAGARWAKLEGAPRLRAAALGEDGALWGIDGEGGIVRWRADGAGGAGGAGGAWGRVGRGGGAFGGSPAVSLAVGGGG